MKMKFLALLGASVAMLGVASADASTIYSNGPIDGTQQAWTINVGFALTNSFTLGSTQTITGFTFGGWTLGGDVINSVDYGFSTSADYAITGNASLSAGGVLSSPFGYDVREYSASITPLTLGPGTYWFALQNATTAGGNLAFWDVNNGPSVAFENTIGNVNGYLFPGSNSSAFTLTGGAVPEPASWAMMVGGFGLVGGAMRARRKAAVSFA